MTKAIDYVLVGWIRSWIVEQLITRHLRNTGVGGGIREDDVIVMIERCLTPLSSVRRRKESVSTREARTSRYLRSDGSTPAINRWSGRNRPPAPSLVVASRKRSAMIVRGNEGCCDLIHRAVDKPTTPAPMTATRAILTMSAFTRYEDNECSRRA